MTEPAHPCAACAHFDPRKSDLGHLGFGQCSHVPAWRHVSGRSAGAFHPSRWSPRCGENPARASALFRRAVHVRMADWTLAALVLPAVAVLAGCWIDRSAARPDRYFEPPKDGQETTFIAIRGVVNFTEHVINPDKADDDQLLTLTLTRSAMLHRALIMTGSLEA